MSRNKRVIKFRAFHRPSGSMVDWSMLQAMIDQKLIRILAYYDGINLNRPPMDRTTWEIHGNPFEHADLTMLEFSGYHDKRNVEVYEGDLIFSPDHNPSVYTVSFIEGGFCATHPKLTNYPIDLNHFSGWKDRMEILGNILQHPSRMQ